MTDHTDEPESQDTLDNLMDVSSAEEVRTLLDQLDATWHRLGGEDNNNVGTVDMGQSPEQSFFERVSNAEDAVIERKAVEAYGDIETAIEELPNSPREAVVEMFGIPDGDLKQLNQDKLARLAEKIRIKLIDSGDEDRPTIEVRDEGIGQHPVRFQDTFLSINSDNKNSKPILIGRFGQGGTNVYRYAGFTIIISRSHEGGPIGWTVVKRAKNYELEDGRRVDTYVYAAAEDGSIFQVDAAEERDFDGSLIRLIEYYAADFRNSISTRPSRTNLRGLTGHRMFSSVLPVRVCDDRGETEEYTVTGNRHLLDEAIYVDQVDGDRTQQTLTVPTDYGPLEVHYWIIDPAQSEEDLSRHQIVKKFADPSAPIVFTLSGQIHHEERKALLDHAELGFLKDRIIIEVNFDKLDEHNRNLVFSSTRGQAAEGEEYDHVLERLQDTFGRDPDLQNLADYYEEQAKKGSETDDDATNELADLMQSLDLSGVDDGGELDGGVGELTDDDDGEDDEGPSEPYSPEPVEPRHDEPDQLDIVNPDDPIRVRQGGTLTVHLEVNAVDEFDDRDDVTYKVIPTGEAGSALTRKHDRHLSEGHRYITLAVSEDVEIDATGQFTVRLSWDGGSLKDTRDLIIAEPIKQSPTRQTRGTVPPEIKGVEEPGNGPFSYGDESVVEYTENEDDQDVVWVAMYNRHVQRVLDQVERSQANYDRYTRLYKAHVAFYEVQRQQAMDDENEEQLPEEALNAEQNWFAKTLIQAIAKEVDPSSIV